MVGVRRRFDADRHSAVCSPLTAPVCICQSIEVLDHGGFRVSWWRFVGDVWAREIDFHAQRVRNFALRSGDESVALGDCGGAACY